MKNISFKLTSLLVLVLLMQGCNNDDFEGSDTFTTINRNLETFNSVVVNDIITVNVNENTVQSVGIMVNENLKTAIKTTVSDHVLTLSLEDGSYENATFIVNISTPELQSLQLNDAATGTLKFDGDQLKVEVNGSSELSLEGSAITLNTTLNDAGRINGFLYNASIVNAMSGDASLLEISCSRQLNGEVGQSSTLRYKGTPIINAATSENGRIINAN